MRVRSGGLELGSKWRVKLATAASQPCHTSLRSGYDEQYFNVKIARRWERSADSKCKPPSAAPPLLPVLTAARLQMTSTGIRGGHRRRTASPTTLASRASAPPSFGGALG